MAQTVLAGVLALSRQFPRLWQAQHDHRWTPLIGGAMPRDLAGQQATILGWGPIGQSIARYLQMLGLRVAVVRQRPLQAEGVQETPTFEAWQHLLPATDWLVLACPLTAHTWHIADRQALALLPTHAHVVNVSRGEIVEETSLVDALIGGSIAGAFLDVFTHEPLDAAVLASMRDVRCKESTETVRAALVGNYQVEHLFALSQELVFYDFYQERIAECDAQIERSLVMLNADRLAPETILPKPRHKTVQPNAVAFDSRPLLYRLTGMDLTQIHGAGPYLALRLVAECGTDFSKWPTAKHFTSWLTLAPGCKISDGKVLSSHTRKTTNRV